jgi:hypothetical protein
MGALHPTLELTFGARVAGAAGTPRLERRALGTLTVGSGRIVGCDPLTLADVTPFELAVPPGRHPVEVALAHFDHGDVRVAFATLRLADAAPLTWEPAVTAGQDPASLGPDEYFGYPVDAGTGAFVDAVVARHLADAHAAGGDAADRLVAELERTQVTTWAWADFPVAELDANVIAFTSGFGDGDYPSYVGRDAAGRPVRLLTDFLVLEPPPPAATPVRARPWWRFWS